MSADDLIGPVAVHSGGTIRYANGELCTLLGVDVPTALTEHSLREFVAERDWDMLTEQFERLGVSSPVLGRKIHLTTATGDELEAIAVSSCLEWQDTTHIQTSFIDISEKTEGIDLSMRENAMHEAPIGITIADATRPDEPLVYVNDRFVELTGYTREETIGNNCRFLQGADTRQEPIKKMREAIDAEKPVTVELRNYRKDGSLFWNRITITPVPDEAGAVTHFLGFQKDITEKKVYEREKALFEKHAETSDQVMYVTDAAGTIEYVNPAFERVTGYSASEALGETPSLLTSGEQDEDFYEDIWETIERGETWEGELINRTKYGERYQIKQTIVPITDCNGTVTHYTIIQRDITDEQLTQQVLNVLDRVLRHNVRTAVSVIDGYAEVLEQDETTAKQQTASKKIRKRSADLKKISEQITTIRSLLDGRSESTQLALSKFGEMVDHFQKTHEAAHIDVTIDVTEDRAIANGDVLQVALKSAIENAVEHNDQETPTVEITVTQSGEDNTVAIDIADNGPPIPDSEWEIIQAGMETPLEHTSGIGLWLLYWSVVALGGTIERTANEPRGNILTLEVPLTAEQH